MSVSIPARALICAHLATQDNSTRQRIEHLFSKEAVDAMKDKKHKGIQTFKKALLSPIGEIIPFTGNNFDIDLAYFFAHSAVNGYLFSKSSLVSAGAARITKTYFEYLDKWFDSSSSDIDFIINPGQREKLRSLIQAQQHLQLDVVVDNNVSFKIHLSKSRNLSEKNSIYDDNLDVQLLDPAKERSYPTPYKGIKARYDKKTNTININASTPEAILQLSAYASEGWWLMATSDDISTCFPIPPLDDPGPHAKVWATDWDVSKSYVWSACELTVATPLDLASRCAQEFHWFFVGQDMPFLRMIVKENS